MTASADSSLDFVQNQQNLPLIADPSNLLEVILLRNLNPSLSLNGLKHYGNNIFIRFNYFFYLAIISKLNQFKVIKKWPVIKVSVGLFGARTGGQSPSPKIVGCQKDFPPIGKEVLFLLGPFKGHSNSQLIRLHTSIEHSNKLVSKIIL